MNPYFLTIAFLMLMGILTSSEVSKFAAHSLENQFFSGYMACKVEKEELACMSQLQDLSAETSSDPNPIKPKDEEKEETSKSPSRKRHSTKLGFNLDRPPNNSRLNLYFLMHEEGFPKKLPKDFSYYEMTARLIRLLYEKAPFYTSGCEYRILDELKKLKEKTENFTYVDDLASLTFENEETQKIFYLMLKGREGFSSLLDFITFDKITSKSEDRKINLMFAHPPILRAIFPDKIVDKLVAVRDRFWEEILDQETHRLERENTEGKNRKIYKDELKIDFESILLDAGMDARYKNIIDFTLGKYGNVFYVTDPHTQIVSREKYQRLKKTEAQQQMS